MKSTSEPIDLTRFDVREIPCRVKHAQIFQRWSELPVGEHFVLINDHDPIPLWYQFVAEFSDGFDWEYLQRGPEEFQVKITKLRVIGTPTPTSPSASSAQLPTSGRKRVVNEIDTRGLEPPEPLILILDALEALPHGQQLRAITDRQPCHLFGEAEIRGFTHDCTEQPDHTWVTLLRRA